MTPLADLLTPCLDESGGAPLYRRLYHALREGILGGQIKGRLPSTRRLAELLGISRNSVANAFDLLQAEGYVTGKTGSGSFVADNLPDQKPQSPSVLPLSAGPAPILAARTARLPKVTEDPPVTAPFNVTPAIWSDFPWASWRRLLARPWRKPALDLMIGAERAGLPELRRAVADLLGATRAMRLSADQVLITAGSQQALDIACRLLVDPGDKVMVEDPGFFGLDGAILASGGEVVPQPVDGEGMIVPADLSGIRAVQVTPSRNFPLGGILSLPRRLALLRAAGGAGAWIIEDDFDAEFRFAGRPLAALFSLDREARVLYAGTFSRTMFPALRLGYLVVPDALADSARAMRAACDGGIGTPGQAALAAFIAEGHYGAHLRRQRLHLAAGRQCLAAALESRLGDVFEILPSDGGLSLTALFRKPTDDKAVAARLLAAGIVTRPLSGFHRNQPARRGLVLSFAGWSEQALTDAVERMVQSKL